MAYRFSDLLPEDFSDSALQQGGAYLVATRACQRPSVRVARDRQSEAGG